MRSDVEALTQRLSADVLRRTRDGMVPVINATRQKIAAAGTPPTVCPQLTSMWNSAEFDTRRSAAAAYRLDGSDAAQVTTRTGGGTPPAPPPAARRRTHVRGSIHISRRIAQDDRSGKCGAASRSVQQ